MSKIGTNKKMWGGRFTTQTHADVEKFLASIHFDAELAQEDILGSMAHSAMLAHCNIITAQECQLLQQGLQQVAKNIAEDKAEFTIADEDVHMNIERMLTEIVGETAGKLHTARSRNDQVSLDLHLYLRRQMVVIIELLTQLQLSLVKQAEKNLAVILPGYTHLQRAQPIRLAQHFLAYAAMFNRDSARLKDAWLRTNVSPLGAAALAGTTFPIDRHYLAESLGFDGIYSNTMDAVSDRDFVVEFLAAASLIMVHLSRLSEELILWSSQEFDFIRLDDAYCTGSSIMPQKKNPDVPELVRGKTGRVYGALFSLLTVLKGLPLAYNKDMQEDKEPVFDTVKTLGSALAIYAPLLDSLKVNKDKMRAAVNEGFLNATDLADYLSRKGLPFRDAHRVSGEMVAYCVEKKVNLEGLSLAEMQKFSNLITQDIMQALAIETVVEARAVVGGSGLASIQQQIATVQAQLVVNHEWVASKHAMLRQIDEKFGLTSSDSR